MPKRSPKPRKTESPAGYPNAVDRSRRRFLTQLGCGAGGLGVLAATGLPRLAHGQSHEVDFSLLEAHPTSDALASPAAPADVAPAAAAPMAAAPPPPAQAPAPPAEPVQLVTENRALWIEPGYLLLVRWERPADNETLVARFEESTTVLADYLSTHLSEMNDLHDLERLHGHERALTDLLADQVSPAQVMVLHLDHDCTQVCGGLGWGPDPDLIPLPGVAPHPDYH